jgi:acetolactate synthase-1/2/3 large subunit
LTAVKRGIRARLDAVSPQADFALAIRAALPEEGIFVTEMTQVGYWSNFAYPVYRPRTFVTAGYQGTLGYGFPTALGAKVGNPATPVVSIIGDGGFGFTLAELSTMVRHRINAIVVVFDDSAYGNVRRIQQVQFGGRTIASDLHNPDFVTLAECFGVAGRRAETAADLGTAVEEAIAAEEPTLIHVPVGEMPNPWTILGYR